MVFVVLASIYYHFFPLTAIMLIALALLDDVPIMTIAFDNASVPPQPVKWELDRVLVISSVLGLLGVIQSFGLQYLGDTLHHLDHPQLQTMMFLQLVAGSHRIQTPSFSLQLSLPKSPRYSCAARVGLCHRFPGESSVLFGPITWRG